MDLTKAMLLESGVEAAVRFVEISEPKQPLGLLLEAEDIARCAGAETSDSRLPVVRSARWVEPGKLGALGAFAVVTVVACLLAQLTVLPDRWFALFRMSGWAWLVVTLLYPLVLALPQEVVFRPLFFRRYQPILPGHRCAMLLNALIFSLAHLLYWNMIVAVMTFGGGLVFAWAYEVRRSFSVCRHLARCSR